MKEYVKCIGYSGNPSIPAGTCVARKRTPREYPRCVECSGGVPISAPAELGKPVLRDVSTDVESYRREPKGQDSKPMQTATPNMKKCMLCGELLTLDKFAPHGRAKDKRKRWCMNCNGDKNKKPSAAVSGPTPAPKPETSTKKQDDMQKHTPGPVRQVVLDFRKYPELLELLQKTAHNEFRSPEDQVFYCLSRNQCGSGAVEKGGSHG